MTGAMRAAYALLGLHFSLSGCTAHIPAASPDAAATRSISKGVPPPAPQEADLVAIVERTLPAVVLVLNTHPDGQTMYGAGLLIEPGLVLTSQHVIAGAKVLGAMLYRPGRTSYTPMDGGLSRFLFENQTEAIAASEVAGDATSDLALLRLDADTSAHPTLPIARDPVRPGDRVLALGHPHESVWSFTQGVVGAIEQGAIQHDAAISTGSSGGPLLNLRGEVVGINIAKVLSEPHPLAFARPIALAARYLGDRSVGALPLDLSTPGSAAVSCWRGQEIGRLEVGECFDWESAWEMFSEIAVKAARIAPAPAQTRLRAELADPHLKERWILRGKHHVAAYFVDGTNKSPSAGAATDPVPPELAHARAEAEREQTAMLQKHPELRGVYADLDNPPQMQARLRLGIRVDRVEYIATDRAWVELAGRNADGSIYRFSELYVRKGDRWLQRCPPSAPDLEALPSSFSPSLTTLAGWSAHELEKLMRDPESLSAARTNAAIRPVRPPRS